MSRETSTTVHISTSTLSSSSSSSSTTSSTGTWTESIYPTSSPVTRNLTRSTTSSSSTAQPSSRNNLCLDDPQYIDRNGITCSVWRNDCESGMLIGLLRYSEPEIQRLKLACPYSCGLCQSSQVRSTVQTSSPIVSTTTATEISTLPPTSLPSASTLTQQPSTANTATSLAEFCNQISIAEFMNEDANMCLTLARAVTLACSDPLIMRRCARACCTIGLTETQAPTCPPLPNSVQNSLATSACEEYSQQSLCYIPAVKSVCQRSCYDCIPSEDDDDHNTDKDPRLVSTTTSSVHRTIQPGIGMDRSSQDDNMADSQLFNVYIVAAVMGILCSILIAVECRRQMRKARDRVALNRDQKSISFDPLEVDDRQKNPLYRPEEWEYAGWDHGDHMMVGTAGEILTSPTRRHSGALYLPVMIPSPEHYKDVAASRDATMYGPLYGEYSNGGFRSPRSPLSPRSPQSPKSHLSPDRRYTNLQRKKKNKRSFILKATPEDDVDVDTYQSRAELYRCSDERSGDPTFYNHNADTSESIHFNPGDDYANDREGFHRNVSVAESSTDDPIDATYLGEPREPNPDYTGYANMELGLHRNPSLAESSTDDLENPANLERMISIADSCTD